MTKAQQRAESEGRLGAYIDPNIVQEYMIADRAWRNAEKLVKAALNANKSPRR